MEQIIKFAKVKDVKSPVRGTSASAGLDFFIPNDFEPHELLPGEDVLIPSGIKVCVPKGYMLMAANKSGVVTSKNACINCGRPAEKSPFTTSIIVGAAIIDEDYQGEIHIHLINAGIEPAEIKPGMKIAQFILVPVLYASPEEVSTAQLYSEKSERGEGGFGSTNP